MQQVQPITKNDAQLNKLVAEPKNGDVVPDDKPKPQVSEGTDDTRKVRAQEIVNRIQKQLSVNTNDEKDKKAEFSHTEKENGKDVTKTEVDDVKNKKSQNLGKRDRRNSRSRSPRRNHRDKRRSSRDKKSYRRSPDRRSRSRDKKLYNSKHYLSRRDRSHDRDKNHSKSQDRNKVKMRDDSKEKRSSSERRHRNRIDRDKNDQSKTQRRRRDDRSISSDRHYRRDNRRNGRDRRRRRRDNSRERRYRRSRDRSSSSHNRRPKRKNSNERDKPKKTKDADDVHPYFQKKSRYADNNQEVFWDGFQWVNKNDQLQNGIQPQSHEDQFSNSQQVIGGADTADGEDQDEQVRQKRIAQSRTVIIEGLLLDLGMTEIEIQKFIRERVEATGDRASEDALKIIDIDMNPFDAKSNNSCISIQVADIFMVAKLKALDGEMCLGQKLRVRKLNEETDHSNAQALAITTQTMLELQGNRFAKKDDDDKDKETQLTNQLSLKTLNPSPVIKIFNAHDRYQELTEFLCEDLEKDMEGEISKISSQFKRIKVVKNGEERLGAEVGSIFCEFNNKKDAQLIVNKLKDRIYDGKSLGVSFIDETLYFSELYIK